MIVPCLVELMSGLKDFKDLVKVFVLVADFIIDDSSGFDQAADTGQ